MKPLSILRWAGSKAKLVPHLSALSPATYGSYVEPFAGSACLYFSLKPAKAILGDINPEVINLYDAVKSDPAGVSDALESIPKTRDAYYTLRAIKPCDMSQSQRAARLIFLMKACFNGVYRTNRSGVFNVPMGDRVYGLPSKEDLLRSQSQLHHTHLVLGDFSKTLELTKPGDWIYMDPPYRSSGRYRGEYGLSTDFQAKGLSALVAHAKKLSSSGRLLTISYSYDEALIDSLAGWYVHRVSTARTVAGNVAVRGKTAELILTNYKTHAN